MRIAATTFGDGAPHIIALHGLLGQGDNLRFLTTTEHKGTFHLLDLPNHGRSDFLIDPTFSNTAECIHAYIDEAIGGNAPYALVGHSLGGKIAMRMATLRPARTQHITVLDIAPVAYPKKHEHIFSALADLDAAFVRGDITNRADADACLAEHLEDAGIRQWLLKGLYRKQDNDSAHWALRYEWRHLWGAQDAWLAPGIEPTARFDGAALFLYGTRAGYVTDMGRTAIRTHFPNADIHGVDADHWLHVERQAEVIAHMQAAWRKAGL